MQIIYKEKIIEVPVGIKAIDVFKNQNENMNEVLACRFNNEVKSLDHELLVPGELEPIDYSDIDGKRIYVRGIMYIMSKAFRDLYPDIWITINYQLSNAMFCELDNMKITDEMITNIKAKMQEIISKDIPITKVVMTRQEAEEFYEKEKTLRGILQLEAKDKTEISLYYCEDYYNYFYGVMPISTGYITTYDISRYKDGILIRYPGKQDRNELAEFEDNKKLFHTLEEYEDIHKVLGINTVYKLNNIVRENKISDYIILDEALHEKKIAKIADDIASRKQVKMVLIAGPSSSGKTTFAQRLGMQLKLNGLKPVTISVDNYFVEREATPRDELGNYDFESINAIDLELFNRDIAKLLNGEEIDMPTFNFTTGSKEYLGKKMSLKPDEVLVVEGIHCLNDELTSSIPKERKYKVYISALTVLNVDYYNRISTTDTRLIRRIVRDNQFRGYSALHTLQMWYSVRRGEEKNIFPYQEQADSMFNSSLIYELGVLKDFAMPLLAQIDKSHKEYSEAKRLYTLLSFFESISIKDIPKTSLLKEFIGDSIFEE